MSDFKSQFSSAAAQGRAAERNFSSFIDMDGTSVAIDTPKAYAGIDLETKAKVRHLLRERYEGKDAAPLIQQIENSGSLTKGQLNKMVRDFVEETDKNSSYQLGDHGKKHLADSISNIVSTAQPIPAAHVGMKSVPVMKI